MGEEGTQDGQTHGTTGEPGPVDDARTMRKRTLHDRMSLTAKRHVSNN